MRSPTLKCKRLGSLKTCLSGWEDAPAADVETTYPSWERLVRFVGVALPPRGQLFRWVGVGFFDAYGFAHLRSGEAGDQGRSTTQNV